MKTNQIFHWLIAAALAALTPVTAGAMSGHGMGGSPGGGSHGFVQHGFGHRSGFPHGFHGRPFPGQNHFVHHNRRFFVGFDFVAFGFPYWWYPDYYYGYPYDYAYYDDSPIYDYRYWYGLSTAVQTALAQRGYYHGAIDGVIGSGTRDAIRSFQAAQGLPGTGMIDPSLLKALKLPAVPRVA